MEDEIKKISSNIKWTEYLITFIIAVLIVYLPYRANKQTIEIKEYIELKIDSLERNIIYVIEK